MTNGSCAPRGIGVSLDCGSCTLTRPSWLNVVDTMKKINNTSSTSIIEIRLISGSSRWRGRRFISLGRDQHAALVQRVDELHGFLFHAHHQPLDLAPQKAIRDQRGYRDGHPGRRRNERFADAAGQYSRVADPVGRDRIERMN